MPLVRCDEEHLDHNDISPPFTFDYFLIVVGKLLSSVPKFQILNDTIQGWALGGLPQNITCQSIGVLVRIVASVAIRALLPRRVIRVPKQPLMRSLNWVPSPALSNGFKGARSGCEFRGVTVERNELSCAISTHCSLQRGLRPFNSAHTLLKRHTESVLVRSPSREC